MKRTLFIILFLLPFTLFGQDLIPMPQLRECNIKKFSNGNVNRGCVLWYHLVNSGRPIVVSFQRKITLITQQAHLMLNLPQNFSNSDRKYTV